MTVITDNNEIRRIREGGEIIREIFSWMKKNIAEGVSTAVLDKGAEDIILARGAEPAFKGYKGFPATICASINDVVVHGMPSRKAVLAEGDIIGIDVGVKKNGYYTDAARTFSVGKISDSARHLIDVTRECLVKGIEQAIEGNRVSDISNAIQVFAQKKGFKEVRMFVGHGIGRKLHESPEIPNWGEKGKGPVLKEGLLLAIEPMINAGTRKIKVLPDGWTAVTVDGKLSAHFEDTVKVGRRKAEVIT